jgi:hypothetical protein
VGRSNQPHDSFANIQKKLMKQKLFTQ